ncbi:MAG: DUF444 family protein [Calditrichia bacterium]
MLLQIDNDYNRFREIIKGRIKKNLRKYISQGEMIGKKGKDLISIPLPQVDLPRFRFGDNGQGGVGEGEGEPGDPLGGQQGDNGDGQAGNEPGKHSKEVELSFDELAEILGEELELPNIENKGKKDIVSSKDKYTGISKVGPDSLRHFKRTYREALRRQIISGEFNPKKPIVVPIKDDFRYRSWKTTIQPETNAVILYIMDVSGSMGEQQKEIVRTETFWIDTWLRYQYKGIETRFIVHDAAAAEVDRETFFTLKESGGTVISSAYTLCAKIIEEDYSPEEWNIYIFQFSDGDNWSTDDNQKCVNMLTEKFLPNVNLFGYGQVESTYGSGQFYHYLKEKLPEEENLILSFIQNKESIYDSIKEFLGAGK